MYRAGDSALPRGHLRQVSSQLQALRARGPLGAPCDLPVRLRQLGGHGQALAGPRDGGRDAQAARAARVVVVGAHLEVLHVGRGQRHQGNRVEQAVESPGVLVLQPGGAGVLVAHDDDVVLLPVIGQGTRDVELAGRVAVLAVADERAVHPDVEGRREAVEAHSHAAARVQGLRHGLVQCEGTAVDSDAAVTGGGGGLRVLVPIPGHLDVDVCRWPQSLGFKRGGDGHCMHVPLSERTGGVLQRHARARGQRHLPGAVEALAGAVERCAERALSRLTAKACGSWSQAGSGVWIRVVRDMETSERATLRMERTCSTTRVTGCFDERN